jgi:hypothetical protein
MKKITYDEYKQMTQNEIKQKVFPATKDEDIPAVHFTWDSELNQFVLTGYQGRTH